MYRLHGYESFDVAKGYDAERTADTLKEAREQAKYMLSLAYQKVSEASNPIVIVQILDDDRVLVEEVW